jgi:hypothetical protein
MLRVIRSTIWLRQSASPAAASSFGDVIEGAALFGPAAPTGAFWAAARWVAAMEQKTTAENPRLNCRRRVALVFIGHIPRPDARSTLSRRSRCPRANGPSRTEPSPMRGSGLRRSGDASAPLMRRAARLSKRPARYFSRFAASSTMLRSALLLTSSADLTKPRSRVISTFRCSAARSGSMLGSW